MPGERPIRQAYTIRRPKGMANLSIEEILEKVSDLKAESTEKDEVITEQMRQVSDLESKVSDLELKVLELEENSGKADELMDKLAEALG